MLTSHLDRHLGRCLVRNTTPSPCARSIQAPRRNLTFALTSLAPLPPQTCIPTKRAPRVVCCRRRWRDQRQGLPVSEAEASEALAEALQQLPRPRVGRAANRSVSSHCWRFFWTSGPDFYSHGNGWRRDPPGPRLLPPPSCSRLRCCCRSCGCCAALVSSTAGWGGVGLGCRWREALSCGPPSP